MDCGAAPSPDRESGQATVEFALILLPLLILVAGIIYFGIGLNYWLDMNRVANQGARWAAVDNWPPQCVDRHRSTHSGTGHDPTGCAAVLDVSTPVNSSHASGRAPLLDAEPVTTVALCYPGMHPGNARRGDPVKVKLTAPYKFWFVKALESRSPRRRRCGSSRSRRTKQSPAGSSSC